MWRTLCCLCFLLLMPILPAAEKKTENANSNRAETQPPEGEIPTSLTNKMENSEEKLLEEIKFVSLIKDVKGDITKVTDLKLYIIQGRLKTFARCLIVEKGEAEVLVGLSDVACMKRTSSGNTDWDIYLNNGSKMTGNLKVRSPQEYVVGNAIYDDMKFYYSISIDSIEWIAQISPKIDWVSVKDGKLIVKDPK